MPDAVTRCWIMAATGPVEADPLHVASSWTGEAIAEALDRRGLDVAPGVRMAVLRWGDNWHPPAREVIHGALIAVRAEGQLPAGLAAAGAVAAERDRIAAAARLAAVTLHRPAADSPAVRDIRALPLDVLLRLVSPGPEPECPDHEPTPPVTRRRKGTR